MDSWINLASAIKDADLVHYFYLHLDPAHVLRHMDSLKLTLTESQDAVPFNAQVRGYLGAMDEENSPWILKKITDAKELLYQRTCTLAYLLDHWMGTLAAPTTVFLIDGCYYRATKVVQKAMQISSYNYLEQPYIGILRADLVNRWLFFDEDRNPNNYLIIYNTANQPFVCAIDYDKADLTATTMKITGNHDKFGWFRTEKTRFLTLLKPENFDGVSLETFDARLQAMLAIPESDLKGLCVQLARHFCDDYEAYGSMLTANICSRRLYIDEYFRSMFLPSSLTKKSDSADDYSQLGKSFLDAYKN